ncbi:unnamed protein product [Cylindrotheca closterium]|uniref:Uncharacterized protein n=1 Tax=Cylindrotheca closterium TaxID=2856 RepID=A0AAD2FAU6_9STRA|nr:unnamed protein product [Cylindrotheca closterium]
MPTMPLKSLFKRKRRNKISSRGNELNEEYDPVMVEPEHAAQSTSEQKPLLDAKKAQSRKRFEAAKRMFGSQSTPSEQEARETSVTPEKISRFQPNVSRGVESRRDTSMHQVFPPLQPKDSDEVDLDDVEEKAPEKSPRTPQRHHQIPQARKDVHRLGKEHTLPSQRVAWTGSVVGFTQSSASFGQKQSHDKYSAQSKFSSFAQGDDDTAQYEEIDNKDYLIESDDESNEADESPTGIKQDQYASNDFTSFGESYFASESAKQHNIGVFQNPEQHAKSHRMATSPRQAARQRSIDKQHRNDNSSPLNSAPSMDSYLLRGTESDSVLFGEGLAPSASEDFFAGLDAEEETNPSEHMSTNNSLIDNSLIEEASVSIESRQPDSRADYSHSQFQNDFTNSVRHGWDYLEQAVSIDKDERQGGFTKTVQTVRESWDYLEHSLSAKSADSEFDDMVMTIRQSFSNITEDLATQVERALPSSTLIPDQTLTSRQDDLLNTVINNMSFFNEDSTDEELEQELFGAPKETTNAIKEVPTNPKDPDEILDEVLENWSLTSDNPTDQKEQNSSDFANEVPNEVPSEVPSEEPSEESNEEPDFTNESGFIATVRQTLSYLTDDGGDEEDENGSSMSRSHTEEVKTSREEKHEKKESGGLLKSWSFLSSGSRDDDDSRSASDTSSIGTASDDDESAVYKDDLSVDYSDAPSDEEGLSIGGLSRGQGGMLDQVLDHWSYFAAATGLPEDLDEFDDFDDYSSTHSVSESDESTIVEERRMRGRSRKASPKTNRRQEAAPKASRRKKKSSKSKRRAIPETVFSTVDDSESSVDQDLPPSTGMVVNIPLQPLIVHTSEQVNGPSAAEKTIEGDVVPVAQETEKASAEKEDSSNSDVEDAEAKLEASDEELLKDEQIEEKTDEETVSAESTASDSVEEEIQRAQEKALLALEEEMESSGSAVVTGPVLVESTEVGEPGEYGKMNADEESIESIGCATATENVSVQSIQDADDDVSEVFDADNVSESGLDDAEEIERKTDEDESVESASVESESAATVSESLEDLGHERSYFSESEGESEDGSEYTAEYSDESSSTGPIKKTYSASSMKSAVSSRFGQPGSTTDDINTAAKVKSTKGQTGRVVDCPRSSKRSNQSRKKRNDEESEASQPHRRRLV